VQVRQLEIRQEPLSSDLVAKLSARGDLKTFARGAMVICEGECSDSMYILLAGEMKVFTRDPRGREFVYNVLGPGEFFGEMFLDGGRRSASVKATSTSMCAVIGERDLRQFIKEYPEFAEALVLRLIALVRHATEQTRSIVLSGVYERVVTLLNQLSVEDAGVQIIPDSITQQEIADRIGATREMVNHVLGDLLRGGYLARDAGRRLRILKELPQRW